MSTADIRKGDLVKATGRARPELTITGRVRYVDPGGSGLDIIGSGDYYRSEDFDFEVLASPSRSIDEGLLLNAINAWRKGYYGLGPVADAARDPQYRNAMTAVINYLREHDTYNKENSK